MSEDAYHILFSIPQIKSALLMGPDGGGQLKIEFDQTSRAAIVAMLDRATARGGCLFAAAVVAVEEEISFTKETNGRTKRQSKQSQWQAAEKPNADNGA